MHGIVLFMMFALIEIESKWWRQNEENVRSNANNNHQNMIHGKSANNFFGETCGGMCACVRNVHVPFSINLNHFTIAIDLVAFKNAVHLIRVIYTNVQSHRYEYRITLTTHFTAENAKHSLCVRVCKSQETSDFAWVKEFFVGCNILIDVLSSISFYAQYFVFVCVCDVGYFIIKIVHASISTRGISYSKHQCVCVHIMQCKWQPTNRTHNKIRFNTMNKYVKMWFLPCITRKFNQSASLLCILHLFFICCSHVHHLRMLLKLFTILFLWIYKNVTNSNSFQRMKMCRLFKIINKILTFP